MTNTLYYSALAPFYHIRSRERTKYATVLHSKIMYCIAKSAGFLAEGLEKPNFEVIFFHADILLIARILFVKIQRNSQIIRAYYMLNHRIRCISEERRHHVTSTFIPRPTYPTPKILLNNVAALQVRLFALLLHKCGRKTFLKRFIQKSTFSNKNR